MSENDESAELQRRIEQIEDDMPLPMQLDIAKEAISQLKVVRSVANDPIYKLIGAHQAGVLTFDEDAALDALMVDYAALVRPNED